MRVSYAYGMSRRVRRFAVLKGHESNVTSVAFSPNGMHMATGSLDDTVKIWDVATGESVHTFKKGMLQSSLVSSAIPLTANISPPPGNDCNVTQSGFGKRMPMHGFSRS